MVEVKGVIPLHVSIADLEVPVYSGAVGELAFDWCLETSVIDGFVTGIFPSSS